MNWLESILSKEERLVVGLISGTSMDGIDAALVKISGSGIETVVRMEDFICREYSDRAKKLLLSQDALHTDAVSELNFLLGKEFSAAVFDLVRKNDLKTTDIDLVGSHGQTVFHNPPSLGKNIPSTLQLGEPDIICEDTGITTVGDFRTRDVAAGGEGAPLIPYTDFLLFSKTGGSVVAQNIGGISNCTLVTEELKDMVAFDTGPGNCLIDSVIYISSEGKKSFDEDGALAARGSVIKELFISLMENPYLDLNPPKSTGKELFGKEMAEWLFSLIRGKRFSLPDILRTLVEFTVCSIVSAYEKFIYPRSDIEEVILSGGGARNAFMVSRLREKLAPRRLSFSDRYGIPLDAKEAVGFAILANETVCANRTNIPVVTGARSATILGKISIGKNVA